MTSFLRKMAVREAMRKVDGIANVMNDTWDFGQALENAAMALLVESTRLIILKDVDKSSSAKPTPQQAT